MDVLVPSNHPISQGSEPNIPGITRMMVIFGHTSIGMIDVVKLPICRHSGMNTLVMMLCKSHLIQMKKK